MQESKRQKQVGALLMEELSAIFQRLGLSMIDGGLISLTAVKMTPDLLEARIYLSMFSVKDVPAAMKKIDDRGWEIKRELASRVKQQLRRIPTLEYFYDDSLEHADKMDALFRKINEEKAREEGSGAGKTHGKEGSGADKTHGKEGSGAGKTHGKGGSGAGERDPEGSGQESNLGEEGSA